jgi:hypothetical protein
MKRRDLISLGSAALFPSARVAAQSPPSRTVLTAEVDVRRDFGAIGDGIADDWQAIENAGLHLQQIGGGRLYFPAGRYRLSGFGRNITVRSNVEYFGDGHGSVILGSNAGFVSPHGAAFGRSAYGAYDYYDIDDVKPGDQSLRFKSPSDAARFKPSDIVIARSRNAIVTDGDVLPYYVEMNRVTSVAGDRVNLEDVVDDGWQGLLAANVTSHVVQGYSIRDLRIECEDGYPLFVQGSYKCSIRDLWTRGLAVACFNGFTRSMAHHINAAVIWGNRTAASLFEIETGSVRANLHDIDVYLSGTAPRGSRHPLFYCQEFSRRSRFHNIRVAAAGADIDTVFQIMSGAHELTNINVLTKSLDKVLDYFACDPAAYQHNQLGLSLSDTTIETHDERNGFTHGFILHNDYDGGTVENVTIRNCSLAGKVDEADHNLIWFYHGAQKNIVFDGVKGAGAVAMNPAKSDETGVSGRDRILYPLDNVVLRNCEYTSVHSEEMIAQAHYVGCIRNFNGISDQRVRCRTLSFSANTPTAELTMTISPFAKICRRDTFLVRVSGCHEVDGFPGYIQVHAMGILVLTIDLEPNRRQEFQIDISIGFANGTFLQPEQFYVNGTAKTDAGETTLWHHRSGPFDGRVENRIELHAWIRKPVAHSASIGLTNAEIVFRAAELD